MFYSVRGWCVYDAKEYLNEFRTGRFGAVYSPEIQKDLLENLPRLIDLNSSCDKYAYALALYNHGNSYDKNKAFKLTEELLNQNYIPAFDLYGRMFSDGICVPQSYQTAFKWYEKGVQNAFAISEYHLAGLYINGRGVEKNLAYGMQLMEKSADSGYNNAIYYVGYCYYKGLNDYPVDYVTAKNYFEMGDRQYDATCALVLYDFYKKGLGVQQNVQKAFDYLKYASMRGSASASFLMGCACYSGDEIEKNTDSAYSYFLRGAEYNHAEACYFAGAMILNGEILYVDKQKGKDLIKKGAELGSENAKNMLKKL